MAQPKVAASQINVGTGANQIVQLDGSARLPAVDGSQLTNLPSGSVTTIDVLNATAGASALAIGTYAFLNNDQGALTYQIGDIASGADMWLASAGVGAGSGIGVGSWMCMGVANTTFGIGEMRGSTLWLRVA